MSAFRGIKPVLRVTDLDRAVEWYTRVLGLEVAWRSPNDGGGDNCMLHSDDVSVLLSTGSHLRLPPALSGTLYFETDGVCEFWAKVKGQAEIVWPLETMDYGTIEFGIRDPDGYTLAFSEDVSRA